MYYIRTSPGKGQGAFANQLIPRGTCIIIEKALMSFVNTPAIGIFQAFQKFPRHLKLSYLRLTHTAEPTKLEQYAWAIETFNPDNKLLPWNPATLSEGARAVAIFHSNAFDYKNEANGQAEKGLFVQAARLNHSCAPNAMIGVDALEYRVVHVLRDIQPGEELTIDYVDLLAPKAERAYALWRRWKFVCKCAVCGLKGEMARESEARRTRLAELNASLRAWPSGERLEEKERTCLEMLDLSIQEGLIGWKNGELHMILAEIYEKQGKMHELPYENMMALDMARCCFGSHHELTMRLSNKVTRLNEASRRQRLHR